MLFCVTANYLYNYCWQYTQFPLFATEIIQTIILPSNWRTFPGLHLILPNPLNTFGIRNYSILILGIALIPISNINRKTFQLDLVIMSAAFCTLRLTASEVEHFQVSLFSKSNADSICGE